MSGYISVYQKDYLWPPHKPYFPRTDLNCIITAPITDIEEIKSKNDPKKLCKQSDEAATVNLGVSPKAETLEFSPVDTCLKKLLNDNPQLLDLMKKKPSLNALKKFNLERLKTTYQADFDHVDDQSIVDLTGLPEKRIPCPQDEPEAPIIDCRAHMAGRVEMFRRRRLARKDECAPRTTCTLKPHVIRKKRLDDKDLPGYKKNIIPPWSSEYREMINKTGVEIFKILSMSKKKRELLRLMKLLKPRMICNNQEPSKV